MTTTIDIRTLRVSTHAKRDRWERITRSIKAVGGIGEIVFIHDSDRNTHENEKVVCVLTSTGMVFIVNITTNTLVTAYLANVKSTMGLYYSAGIERMPNEIFQRIRYNERQYSELYHLYN